MHPTFTFHLHSLYKSRSFRISVIRSARIYDVSGTVLGTEVSGGTVTRGRSS